MMLAKHHKHRHYRSMQEIEDDNLPIRNYSFPVQRLSQSVDLTEWMTPVENQETMGTCCANTFAGICEYQIKRTMDLPSTQHYIDVSRLFMHYNARKRFQRTGRMSDTGVDQRDMALSLRKYGVCDETYWPYSARLVNVKPSSFAYKQAQKYTVVLLRVPVSIEAIETCLHYQIPVPLDMVLDEDTERNIKSNKNYLNMHQLNDHFIDAKKLHTVLIVGYNHPERYFIIRNSWGADWASNGYFYLPYDFLWDRRRVNYNDCLWTVMAMIPRPKEKLPSIRQLVLPNNKRRYSSKSYR
ncbi:unnamed protein product [Adineta steineri]|uniref:Peptidase C1A papain C-terminal domain-containing protein n=1 Tax=Adineta steineri TaxID=433720 RepID=A0A815M0I6_9BILA|nr:unnamed protein product [Adineta steineri]CAF3992877.1 unnamed protein product [Adineta steineri]